MFTQQIDEECKIDEDEEESKKSDWEYDTSPEDEAEFINVISPIQDLNTTKFIWKIKKQEQLMRKWK